MFAFAHFHLGSTDCGNGYTPHIQSSPPAIPLSLPVISSGHPSLTSFLPVFPQLLYLQLAAAGVASKEADHAASHLGKAVGITTLLKGTAFHASSRRSYLPLDWCADQRVSQVSAEHDPCP